MTKPAIIVYNEKELASYVGREQTLLSTSIVKAFGEEIIGNSISIREYSDGTVQIGTLSDYVRISANGHITYHGLATVFDDLLGDITKVKVVGVGINENAAENTLDMLVTANLSDYVYSSYQLTHCWVPGSTLFPHIHFEQSLPFIPNFLIRYRWQISGGTKTTAWSDYICNTPVFTYISGTLNQIVHGNGIIPPNGYNISDILQIRLIRDNNNNSGLFAGSDPYIALAPLTSLDVHIEKNDLGSNTQYNK